MTEQNSNQPNAVENDLFGEWLGETRYIAQLFGEISDCLGLLATKRTTLEEKIIRKELHLILANYAQLLSAIHERFAETREPYLSDAASLEKLRTLNFSVHQEIKRFLVALRHNFNYVEQYFEFDFCARLTEECCFSKELATFLQELRPASR